MKIANWLLTLFAVIVLGITLWTLYWMRERMVGELESSVRNTVAAFDPPAAILGEPTDALVNFSAAEALVQSARRNPSIRELVVTKTVADRPAGQNEAPIVPYDLLAKHGPNWRERLRGMREVHLTSEGHDYGHLYFELDRSAIESVSAAILAASVALAATLILLIGRLFSQQTTIHRVGTELDQRTRELIRLERLALAGQLTANLLHDLKKPVLNVRHKIEDLPEDAKFQSARKEMGEEINLFFQMLNDSSIEKFVRSDKVQEEYVDIAEILRASTRLVHYERESVRIVENFERDLPPVLAQPFRLVQVFSNLILNAYQAMKGKGTLTLQTLRRGRGVEVHVTDTGPGIPAEILPSIFDPFFTTKGESEGSGLGLAISRLIIEEMKGTLEVDSAPGGPTTFRVWLPGS
ncbi:hypothetical protein HYR69_01930 [Candidatus Sumerlaeota bacterium]|nr:hypothetical protein [Candidatus Sumerlaeota bacterium]MBI3737127.1 hypothetical protein [Candidatus Sumerlaeota bacterium]